MQEFRSIQATRAFGMATALCLAIPVAPAQSKTQQPTEGTGASHPAPQDVAKSPTEFPLRPKYPQLKFITTEQLKALEDAVIIDTRNRVEFDVVHIVGAKSLLVGTMKPEDLIAIRAAEDPRPLVFYCNGVTCAKSYKAGEKARIWGFQNTFVYDAGVFAWAQANPDRTKLFGKLLNAKDQSAKLISKEKLLAVCIDTATFVERARSGKYKAFDLRDMRERAEFQIRLPGMARLSMDRFVEFLEQGRIPKSRIIVLDNVGKQVKWLQYYLIKHDVKDYAFLRGGVDEWVKSGFDAHGNRTGRATPGK